MRVLRAAKGEVKAVGFAPDSAGLVAAYEGAGLHAWDLAAAGLPVRLAPDRYVETPDLFFAPDGRTVFWHAPGAGRAAADRATGRRVAAGPFLDRPLFWFGQTADGRRVFTTHGPFLDPELAAWRRDPDGWTREWAVRPVEAVPKTWAVDPAGERVAHLAERPPPRAWPEYYQLVVRDGETGQEVGYGRYPYSQGKCQLLFRPDGRQLVGVHAMTLLAWPVPGGGTPRRVRNDSRKHFTAAAYHPSGRYLFTTSNDATVVVWDARTWDRVARFTWDVGRLKSIAVSPDGALAAAGSDDGRVVVWDVDV